MRDRMTGVVMAWMLVVIGVSAVAQSEVPEPNQLSTINDYLRVAAMNNDGLKSHFEQWRIAMTKIPQSQALDDPRFTYGYYIEEVETRTGPQKQRFSLSQKFPWFGKLQARGDAAAAAAKAAHHRYEAEKLKLFKNVKQAFYEYAYLYDAIGVARQNLELLKHFEQVAQSRYRTAATSHPDIIRAQIELAMLEDHLTELTNMQQPVVSGLNAMLGRRAEKPLPWPQCEKEVLTQLDADAVFQLIEQQNPELAAFEEDIQSARHRVELAQKRYYPDVSLGLDWIQTDEARGSNVWGSGRDPVIAMISINIPLWTDSYKASESQARAEIRKTTSMEAQKQLDLAAHAVKVLYDVQETSRKADLYQKTLIPKAREMLEVSESSYRTGGVDFLNLIDAQRKLLTFELTYQRILTDHQKRLAELEQLTGGPVPGAKNP